MEVGLYIVLRFIQDPLVPPRAKLCLSSVDNCSAIIDLTIVPTDGIWSETYSILSYSGSSYNVHVLVS